MGRFFNKVDPALKWRSGIEELLCSCRVFSAGLLLIMRVYRGKCPDPVLRVQQLVMCNTFSELGLPPLDTIAALFFNYFMERYWFTNVLLMGAYTNWMVLIICVTTTYFILFVFSDSTLSAATVLPSNAFLVICTLGLGPHAYYIERASLEKFLLATRSDGGEAAEKLIRKGQDVACESGDASLGSFCSQGGEEGDKSGEIENGGASLASLAYNRKPTTATASDERSQSTPSKIARHIGNADSGEEADSIINRDLGELIGSLHYLDNEMDTSGSSVNDEKLMHIDPAKLKAFRDRLIPPITSSEDGSLSLSSCHDSYST